MEFLDIDQVQADAILAMQLRRLAALERQKILDEHNELMRKIADYNDILAKPERQRTIVGDELDEIVAKYGDERRTKILPYSGEMNVEDLIAEENVVVTVTHSGFIKRTKADEYRAQHRGGKGVKCYKITEKTGYVIGVKAVTDENEIMMITTEGIIIQIRMDDVSQLGRITSGVKLINLDAGVTVAQIAKVREKVSDGNQEFDDVDDAMEDVSKPSEVDQEEDDDPAEEHITMPEETEEDE